MITSEWDLVRMNQQDLYENLKILLTTDKGGDCKKSTVTQRVNGIIGLLL